MKHRTKAMSAFWTIMPYGFLGRYQRFGEKLTPKMEAVCFSETCVSTSMSTRRYISYDQHRRFHRRENLIYYLRYSFSFLLLETRFKHEHEMSEKEWPHIKNLIVKNSSG